MISEFIIFLNVNYICRIDSKICKDLIANEDENT